MPLNINIVGDSQLFESYEFLKSVLDTITEHIVVIDIEGNIKYVNKSWILFGKNNNCLIKGDWKEVNYLKVCENSAAMGDEFGQKAREGINKVIRSEQAMFYLEYPCNSPNKKRWFMMRITPLKTKQENYFVISHQNITERKLAEEKISSLSYVDGLTGIPNRRRFDEFLNSEWRRCLRLKMPISLAIIDLDHFKLLNDTYGHQAGDECLKKIGYVLNNFTRRPSDICARYGGDEFALVFGDTDLEIAIKMINKLVVSICELKIPNKKAPIIPTVTVSVGIATMWPDGQKDEKNLIETADKQLYLSKKDGRNQISFKLDQESNQP